MEGESADPPKSQREPTDALLVEQALEGAQWAEEALYRRHYRFAFGRAARLLPADPELEDIVQDAFFEALSKLPSLDNGQAFQAWLGKIIVFQVSRRLRRRRLLVRLGLRSRQVWDPDTVISRQASPETRAEIHQMYAVLERLPPEMRLALLLHRAEGLTLPEVASQLGLSLATTKRRLQAAERAVAEGKAAR